MCIRDSDSLAKPDLVAPGVGIESIAEAGSTLWNTKPLMRLWGTVPTAAEPYLSLSGTSMAAPVVSATIALMLQANPSLKPHQVKALLQLTAENRQEYDAMAQGAGFLNARAAVEMAQATVSDASSIQSQVDSAQQMIWATPVVPLNAVDGVGHDRIVWSAETSAPVEDIVWRAPAIRRPRILLVEPALR